MNEEKQLEFLDQNIKVDSDFKQFFREERLHEVLANTGEKNVDDFLYCFQPKQISDEIFYEWYSNSDEFLFWAIPGFIALRFGYLEWKRNRQLKKDGKVKEDLND